MIEIKFCENNFSHGTEEVVNKLKKEAKNVSVEVEPCLGYCSDCAVQPYALVDGELVLADSADELFDKISDKLK